MRVLIAQHAGAGRFLLVRQDAASTLEGAGQPWGVFHDSPLLGPGLATGPDLGGRIVLWTGSLASEPLARDPRTWGPEGMRSLEQACDAALERVGRAGGRLLLRPHARHVLSDVQRCLTFMLKRQGQPIGLLLDPAAMLDGSMLEKASDHLRRCIETLGPIADGIWLANVTGPERDEEDAPLAPAPFNQGLIAPPVVLDLIRGHAAADTPVIVSSAGELVLD